MNNNIHHPDSDIRYPLNAFDFSTDHFCIFSNQVIHLVIDLDEQFQYELLKNAVDKVSSIEPVIRCRVIREQDTLFWQDCPEFNIDDHVIQLTSMEPARQLPKALSFPLDPYVGNLFNVVIIKNSQKNGDTLVINVHHIVMDAHGLKDFAGLIMRFYDELQSGHQTEMSITPINSRELPRLSDIIQSQHRENPEDVIGWCSPITVPVHSLQADEFRFSNLVFDRNRVQIIHETRKRWGITVNDLMIAVLSRAISSILDTKSEIIVPLYTTIDLRRYLPVIPERSLLNFSTSFEVRVPVKPGESLEDTGRRVHSLMNMIKSNNPGVIESTEADSLLESGYSSARKIITSTWKNIQDSKNKTTIFSNTGIISPEQISPVNLKIKNAYFLPSFFQPPGFFFFLSTFDDIMTLSASYGVPAYNQDMVNRLFSKIEHDTPGFYESRGEYNIIV